MNQKYKNLSKNILLFSISSFVPKAIAFLMIPFYTSILVPAEYGVVEMIATTVSLLLPIFTVDIQDAVLRFAFDNRYKMNEVFSVAIVMIIKGIVLVALIGMGISLCKIQGLEIGYILFALWQYAILSLQNSCNLFCRAIDEIGAITVSSLINAVLNAALNLLLLAVIPMGVIGYLLASSISVTISLVYMVWKAKLYHYLNYKINRHLQKEMVKFSFPLVFSCLAWWINNASDRYIVTAMVGITASGLYAMAYKIPAILTVFQTVFFQAWSISALKYFDKNDKDGFISRMYTLINSSMIVVCSIIILLNIPISRILYSNDFFQAWEFVPPLLLSVVFNTNALFVGAIYTIVKKTKILSYTTLAGAGINIVGNIILIYLIGPYGAALSTMLGYFTVMIIRLALLQRIILLKVRWTRDLFAVILLLVQVCFAKYGGDYLVEQCIIFAAMVFLYMREIKFCFIRVQLKLFS